MKMSASTSMAALAAMVLVASCTGGGRVVNDRPAGNPQAGQARAGAEDPLAGLKARFEKAYFEIGCQANRGRDPLNSIMPIVPPAQYLEDIENSEGGRRDKAERTIRENGFGTIADFRSVILRMRSDGRYWQTVQDRYIDELIKCRQ